MLNCLIIQRQWLWSTALVLALVLTGCVTQLPSITPESPAVDVTTDVPTAKAEATESVASDSVVRSGKETPVGEQSTAATLELIGGAPIPSDEIYKGLPVGFTEDGFLYRGDPDAPIVMIEYSDYGCPFCNRHFIQTEPAIDESYVRTGQVRVVFHDFPLVSLHPNAPTAHKAGLCVAAQGLASLYWDLRAEMFRSVDEWQTAPEPLPIFARLAEAVGADMAVYEECMAGEEQMAVVQERIDSALARGFNATPSFQFVRLADGVVFEAIGAQAYEQFAGIVDSAVAGEMPVAAAPEPEAQPEGIPFWATAEGWQPDPDRPGYNMAGDQYRGDINAPLTVIEFGDFQCPFCKQYKEETEPILDEKYVDTGKVLWVYKHFPLNIHPQAPAAGIAAECAAEQGEFWAMNSALFDSVETWSIEDPTKIFQSLATEVGLDANAFTACLTDPEIAARVNSDLVEGTAFVQGTPTFIIVRGSEGSIIPGALPEASFSKVLDEELAAAGVTE